MQIREKGKKVLCIRTEYKTELKRTIGVTVASQDKYLSTVSEEVCRLLTEQEVDQLKKWLSERTENQSVGSHKMSLSTIVYSVRSATKALTVDDAVSGLSIEKADELWDSLAELQKALKKAGFKRPVRQTEKGSAVDNKTGQLQLDK